MKMKRFLAKDMRQGLNMVSDALGADAVILSNKKHGDGIEIVAAVDYNPTVVQPKAKPRPKQATIKAVQHGKTATQATATYATDTTDFSNTQSKSYIKPKPKLKAITPDRLQPINHPTINNRVKTKTLQEQSAITAMGNEISSLRQMMQHQLAGLAWKEMEREQPVHTNMLKRLTAMGFSAKISRMLVSGTQDININDDEEKFAQIKHLLVQSIETTHDDILSTGGVVALIGPTGVGKTTTIAKLAARYALRYGNQQVALITTDAYRIAAFEQLRTYGRIIGVQVYMAEDGASLSKTLQKLQHKRLVLIDTAGMSHRDIRLAEQFKVLSQGHGVIKNYLVLSATSQRRVIEEAVKTFQKVGLSGCILSKIDETSSLGEVLSVVIQHNLPLAYLTDGQRVPEDLKVARSASLVQLVLDLERPQLNQDDRLGLACAFGDAMASAYG